VISIFVDLTWQELSQLRMGRDAPRHAVFGGEIAMRLSHQQEHRSALNQPPNCACGRTCRLFR
jgi:hypothetical protein